MGLIARFFEEKGVPTASIYLQKAMAEAVPAPRMLLLRWPFGHPFGEPGDPSLQATVLHRLLGLFERADGFGYRDEPGWTWRRTDPDLPVEWRRCLETDPA